MDSESDSKVLPCEHKECSGSKNGPCTQFWCREYEPDRTIFTLDEMSKE